MVCKVVSINIGIFFPNNKHFGSCSRCTPPTKDDLGCSPAKTLLNFLLYNYVLGIGNDTMSPVDKAYMIYLLASTIVV